MQNMTAEDIQKEVEELAEVAGVETEKMARMIQFAGEGWDEQ